MKATKEVEDTINGILKKRGMYRLMTQVVAIEVWNAAVEECAKNARMVYHDGHNKTNHPTSHHQSGADNIQVDRDSILSIKIEDDEK